MRLGSRWLWIVVHLALVMATAVVRGVFLQRDVRRELGDDIQGPLRVAEAQVEAWSRRQIDRASLAAALIAVEPDRRAPAGDAGNESSLARRFDALARVAARDPGYAGAWLTDARGRVLAQHHRDSTVRSSPPTQLARANDPATVPRARLIAHACGVGTSQCADAHAPILAANGLTGWLVLRVAVGDSAFPRLDARARTETARTTLLAREGDSVRVLATASRDTGTVPRAFALDSLPDHIHAALGGQPSGGAATPGLTVERSIYSAAYLPTTGWVLLREMQGDELVGWILLPAASEIALVAAIFLFGYGYLRSRLRIAALHREQEMTRVRADFLAGASHELRTPLANIRLFAELLRKGSLRKGDDAERAVRIIEKEASRLSILVDNILSYVRLRRPTTAPVAPIHPVPTDIARHVGQVAAEFTILAAERGMRVEAAVDGEPLALVDSQALRQVLLNYLDNAMKYGRSGQTVRVGAQAAGDRVRVWVDDEGAGVPASEREKVWTVFHRGEAAERSGIPGSGIGLAVVRDLVTRHGGCVAVETAPGGGARFIAEFPRAEHPERTSRFAVDGSR